MANSYENFTLEDWSSKFTEANRASWEGVPSVYAWLQIVEMATSIAELVRLENYSALIDALGDAFGWLCCFAGQYHNLKKGEAFYFTSTLPEMIWHKYPGVCYRCTHKFSEDEIRSSRYLPCVCLATPNISEEENNLATLRKQQARDLKPRPAKLDEWTQMTREIYGPNHREHSLASICLHFLEEVGEVAKGLRNLYEIQPLCDQAIKLIAISDMQDEIADVFSWTMGLLNKIDQILEASRSFYLSQNIANLPRLNVSSVALAALSRWKPRAP
jgi:NTP pyrophosphatase (non-canonical NTP hydrolase)